MDENDGQAMKSIIDINHLYAVVLAGGSGTRLWPLSRLLQPKQLLHLPGCREGRNLLQETVSRIWPQLPGDHLLIVTHQEQKLEIRRHLELLDPYLADAVPILAEPLGRNTAPAIAWAAHRLVKRDPLAVMLVLPADHLIGQPQILWQGLETGWKLAQQGYLVTFGIRPNRPETGYGYIKQGKCLVKSTAALKGYQVKRFVEKPDHNVAAGYLAQGGYYWNSGIFFWRASDFLEAVGKWQPRLRDNIMNLPGDDSTYPSVEEYRRLDNISVDYGIMEPHDRCAVVPLPAEIGWTDLGSWEAVFGVAPKNQAGNFQDGTVITSDCRNSLFLSTHRMIAGLGLQDVIVVETADAVLIAPRQRVQEVKQLTEFVKDQEVFRSPRTVFRPWGTYTILEEGTGYKIKRVEVYPHKGLNLQYHRQRSEHWVVISGQALITRGEESFVLQPNESTFIPTGIPHFLENPGESMTVIIEVQNGDHLVEEDTVTLEDRFGN